MPDLSPIEPVYYSGQGELYIGPVGGYDPDAAVPEGFQWLGNVSALAVTPAEEATEHRESYSGQRSVDRRNVTERNVGISITMEQFHPLNLARFLVGDRVEQAAGSVSGSNLGDPPLEQMIPLAHQGLSAVVVRDSFSDTGGPDPQVVNALDYEVDAGAGMITFFAKTTPQGAAVPPLDISYNHEARVKVPIFTVPANTRYMLVFKGLNTAESANGEHVPVRVELYAVEFTPGGALPLIGEEIAQFELTGQARLDTTREEDDTLGQFGNVSVVTPTEEVEAAT